MTFSANFQIRLASQDDLQTIIDFFALDEISNAREGFSTKINKKHLEIFEKISNDDSNELVVVELNGQIVATLQITYIPYLTAGGEIRALIEAVRVQEEFRGQGLGSKLMLWAIEHARSKGSKLVQLTSNRARNRAINFYKKLGFEDSHSGLKFYF